MSIKIETKYHARIDCGANSEDIDHNRWQEFVDLVFEKNPISIDIESFRGSPAWDPFIVFEGHDEFEFKLFVGFLNYMLETDFEDLVVLYE
ncbi:hypothetical protein [Methylotenera sp.]|uniref:hypothetical protein n=1 Tax=Methylotenera sp. TaxID=2051956 RepID=UPI002488AE19|nr:hypothetical protein [Methylotenera sp.]MDI1362552.1 hypothetical protein [Methylotenera sp.]